jgi:Ni/Fe-hydrogenase subunit HybB-like protein
MKIIKIISALFLVLGVVVQKIDIENPHNDLMWAYVLLYGLAVFNLPLVSLYTFIQKKIKK